MVDAIRRQRESEAERQRLIQRCIELQARTPALLRVSRLLAAALERLVIRGRLAEKAEPAEYSVRRAHYG